MTTPTVMTMTNHPLPAGVRGTFVAPLLLLILAGCGGRDDAYTQKVPQFRPAVAFDEKLLWIDADVEAHRAYLLDVKGDLEPAIEAINLPVGPSNTWRRNGDHDETLVLCAGRRGSADDEPAPAVLAAVEASGKVREYALGDPFGNVIQSSDGRFAFLLKSGQADRLLDNPNAVAIVDLEADPDDDEAVTLRTLRSFGDSPHTVRFSPSIPVLGDQRRLAVALSRSTVTLIDLDHLDRRETSVQLSGATSDVEPAQVIFSERDGSLYLRGDASDDVFVFQLERRPDDRSEDGGPRNDFRPSINQLVVGGRPNDLALYDTSDGDERLLVVASNPNLLAIVDAASSRVTTVPLPSSQGQILLFDAESPSDAEVSTRALLYNQGSNRLTFVDLENIEERTTRNVEELTLEAGVTQVIPLLDEGRVLFLHGAQFVSILDLAARTIAPIRGETVLSDAVFDQARARFWVAPQGQDRIAWFDLETGDTPEVRLDAVIQQFVPVLAAGKLAVVHNDPLGYVTVLDAANPSRERAGSIRSFLLADALDGVQR